MNLDILSSEELMRMYQEDSPEDAYAAFEELYFRYNNRVYFYCLKKLTIRSDAEDVVQKVFLKIHESKHLYNSKYKFEQWIFVISKTAVLDTFRKRTSDLKKIEMLFNEQEFFLPNDQEEDVGLLQVLDLDEEQKRLLEFKYIEEMTYEEISKVLNKSEVSIRKMVSRLVSKLKKGNPV